MHARLQLTHSRCVVIDFSYSGSAFRLHIDRSDLKSAELNAATMRGIIIFDIGNANALKTESVIQACM